MSLLSRHISVAVLLVLFNLAGLDVHAGRRVFIGACGEFPAVQDDSTRIRVLLESAVALIEKPGENKRDLDSAERLAQKALELNHSSASPANTGRIFLVLSKVFGERKDKQTAMEYTKRAQRIFSADTSLRQDEAESYLQLAGFYGINSVADLKKKIEYYEIATRLLNTGPKSLRLANALKYLGDLYNVYEDNNRSVACLRQAINIYHTLNYDQLQDIYCLLGSVLNRLGAAGEALKYLLLAEKSAIRYKDSSETVTTLYNRMGNVLNSLNQIPNASRAFERSLFYAAYNHNNDAFLMVSANLSWSYIRTNRISDAVRTLKEALRKCDPVDTPNFINLNTTMMEAYLQTHDIKNALEYNDKIKKIIKQFYLYDFLVLNYHHAAGTLFLYAGDFEEAQRHINASVAITKKSNDIRDIAGVEKLQYKLDSARNRPWEALKHLDKYRELSDSLSRRNHDKEISQLQIAYETEQKDKDITELKQRALLQERALTGEKTSRKLFIAGMILFILLTIVLYSRYRLKQRTNKDLQRQQEAINTQNLSLRQLLDEREWLLKEVHHRVKNNLQIVISLLDSQSAFLSDKNAIGVIRESRHRMQSISLVHQKLYQNEHLAAINISDYLFELTGFLQDSFNTAGRIKFIHDVDRLCFDVSQIVPLGLILNEAVTNSIKYAFNGQQDCVIGIKIKKSADDFVDVSIVDNGCGLPGDFNIKDCKSLGMNLIQGLSKQLQGELSIFNDHGLHIFIRLKRLRGLNPSAETRV